MAEVTPPESRWQELRREVEALPWVDMILPLAGGGVVATLGVDRAAVLAIVDRLAQDEPGPDVAARFVATHWRDAVMANDELRRTGMSHPLAMVLAALDGETDPAQLGLSEDVHDAFRAALRATPAHLGAADGEPTP